MAAAGDEVVGGARAVAGGAGAGAAGVCLAAVAAAAGVLGGTTICLAVVHGRARPDGPEAGTRRFGLGALAAPGIRTIVLASLPVGIAVAYLLARGRFPGKSILDGVVFLPLILPPVVTGYLLLLSFGRRGPIGAFLDEHFGIVFSFRWTGAALACAVMAFPLLVRSIRLSIEAVDRRLEEAAGTLGANPLWVFLLVTLPLTLPGIIAGMILCFAKAMGEFGATITFVSNIPGETQTLPSAIYTFTQIPGGESGALRLTLVSIGLAFAAMIASELLARPVARMVRGI